MSNAEYTICDKFHSYDIDKKVKMLTDLPVDFYERAVRIIGRLDFAKLPQESQNEFQDYLNKIASLDKDDMLIDHIGKPRKCLTDIYEDMQQLRINESLTKEQQELLNELEEYLF